MDIFGQCALYPCLKSLKVNRRHETMAKRQDPQKSSRYQLINCNCLMFIAAGSFKLNTVAHLLDSGIS